MKPIPCFGILANATSAVPKSLLYAFIPGSTARFSTPTAASLRCVTSYWARTNFLSAGETGGGPVTVKVLIPYMVRGHSSTPVRPNSTRAASCISNDSLCSLPLDNDHCLISREAASSPLVFAHGNSFFQ